MLVYRATEAGVEALWGNPRFALARQDLFLVSISAENATAINDLEENEDIMVVAAETAQSLRKTHALPGPDAWCRPRPHMSWMITR